MNKKDNIYIYLWEDLNAVYIGRTVNPKGRHYQHKHRKSEKTYQFSAEHGIEHPKMTIIEKDLTIDEGVGREKYWIEYYRNNTNYNVLNKTCGGQINNRLYVLSEKEKKERRKAYNQLHKEERNAYYREYRRKRNYEKKLLKAQKKVEKKILKAENRIGRQIYKEIYYERHKNDIKKWAKKYRDTHKEEIKKKRLLNEEKIKEHKKLKKNEIKKYQHEYYINHREEKLKKMKEQYQLKKKNNM